MDRHDDLQLPGRGKLQHRDQVRDGRRDNSHGGLHLPSYSVTFSDVPSTAQVLTNGIQQNSGNVILNLIGTGTINAIGPSLANSVFSSWTTSASTNTVITNAFSQNTFMTVEGNAVVTANFNALTQFYETGLPSGATWNVLLGTTILSNTVASTGFNIITFNTVWWGANTFSIPNQANGGSNYQSSNTGSTIYAGNALAVTFSKIPPITATPNPYTLNNLLINLGQQSLANTIISGGSGGPYSADWSFFSSNMTFSTVDNTITGVTAPSGAVADPIRPRIYILTDLGIVPVNTLTDAAGSTISIGNPYEMAINPAATLGFAATTTGISTINLVTLAVVNTVSTQNPHGVAVNHREPLLYATNYLSGTVNIISVATNSRVGSILVGEVPAQVLFNPNGTKAYVLSSSTGINVISTATNTLVNSITIPGATGFAFNPSGSLAYVTTSSYNTVSVIQVSTNTIVNTISVGTNPTGISIDPSGTLAYVADEASVGTYANTISVINLVTNTVVNTITVSAEPFGLGFTSSGTKVYVSEIAGTVLALGNLAETGLQELSATTNAMQLTANAVGSTTLTFTFGSSTFTPTLLPSTTASGVWSIYGFVQDNGVNVNYWGSNSLLMANSLTVNAMTPGSTCYITLSNSISQLRQNKRRLQRPHCQRHNGHGQRRQRLCYDAHSGWRSETPPLGTTTASGSAPRLRIPSV